MSLEVGMAVGLIVSVAANGLLIWYARRAFSNSVYVADGLEDVAAYIGGFRNHLEQVYEMETFYGDETLAALLAHAKDTQAECLEFRDSFALGFGEEAEEAEEVENADG